MATLETKLEAILFYRGEPEKRSQLAKLLEVSNEELDEAVNLLSAKFAGHGIQLLSVGDQLELVTAPETSDIVTKVRKNELTRNLGKAGSETLAVVLYRGPVSRADIEHVRGVNCSFILRNMTLRDLVEKVPNPKNKRSVLYQATPELLKHLGVTNIEDLPNYKKFKAELDAFEASDEEQDNETEEVLNKDTTI